MISPRIQLAAMPLLLGLGLTLALTIFTWALVLQTGLLALDQDVLEYWLPLGLGVVLAAIFIIPRLKLLALKSGRTPGFYFAAAMAVIALPAVLAQHYLHNSTGTLVTAQDLAAIPPSTQARYFTGARPCLSKNMATPLPVTSEDSHGNDFTITLNVYLPFCVNDASQSRALVWTVLQYRDTMPAKLSDDEKNARYRALLSSAQTKLDAETMGGYPFYERATAGDLRTFAKALTGRRLDPKGVLLLNPQNTSFADRAGDTLPWLIGILIGGNLIWAAMVMAVPVNEEAEKQAQEKAVAAPGAANLTAAIFIPSLQNYGLPLLLDVNILVFLAMAFSGAGVIGVQTDDLIAWGANYGPLLHGAGVARLFTSQFVHAGLMHIANNMYGLVIAALFLTPVATNLRLIGFYLICGLGAGLASFLWHPQVPSVGASGAIFGLFAMALVLSALKDRRFLESGKAVWINAGVFIAINLALGAATPAIDNAAHLGGLVTGLAIGLILYLTGRAHDARFGVVGS